MVMLAAIVDALNARKNRVLLFAQAALPESQYQAFRKLFLGEFGRDGLERELERLFAGKKGDQALERLGRE
jgi:hypothetical protein